MYNHPVLVALGEMGLVVEDWRFHAIGWPPLPTFGDDDDDDGDDDSDDDDGTVIMIVMNVPRIYEIYFLSVEISP